MLIVYYWTIYFISELLRCTTCVHIIALWMYSMRSQSFHFCFIRRNLGFLLISEQWRWRKKRMRKKKRERMLHTWRRLFAGFLKKRFSKKKYICWAIILIGVCYSLKHVSLYPGAYCSRQLSVILVPGFFYLQYDKCWRSFE